MTEEKLIYTLTVPCNPESQAVFEGLCETFISEDEGLEPEVALTLRLSVAEACKNALAQEAGEGHMNVATLTFCHRGDKTDPQSLILKIEDPGRGLVVKGSRPPYPGSLVGQKATLFATLRQEVIAEVLSQTDVRVYSPDPAEQTAQLPARETMVKNADPKGIGMLALCRCWHRILYTYDPAKGTTLRLEKPAQRL